MNITIRKAIIGDLPILLDINLSSFEANKTFDPHIDMNWIHTNHAKKYFTDAITKEGFYTVIAQMEEEQVGFLVLAPKQLAYRAVKMIELDILAVKPQYRSKGIGKILVEDAKRWAKSNAYQSIYVSSYSNNMRSVAFYQREGFTPLDIGLELNL